MRDEESFTAESLLNNDSTRSPIWPTTPIIIPITIAFQMLIKPNQINLTKIIVPREKINPKIAPSTLFFGLTRGNNLCFPKAVPK